LRPSASTSTPASSPRPVEEQKAEFEGRPPLVERPGATSTCGRRPPAGLVRARHRPEARACTGASAASEPPANWRLPPGAGDRFGLPPQPSCACSKSSSCAWPPSRPASPPSPARRASWSFVRHAEPGVRRARPGVDGSRRRPLRLESSPNPTAARSGAGLECGSVRGHAASPAAEEQRLQGRTRRRRPRPEVAGRVAAGRRRAAAGPPPARFLRRSGALWCPSGRPTLRSGYPNGRQKPGVGSARAPEGRHGQR